MRCNVSSGAMSGSMVCRSCCGVPSERVHVRTQADETLGKFMDYCTYGHMIDNVVLIVTGTLHERDVQVYLGVA